MTKFLTPFLFTTSVDLKTWLKITEKGKELKWFRTTVALIMSPKEPDHKKEN